MSEITGKAVIDGKDRRKNVNIWPKYLKKRMKIAIPAELFPILALLFTSSQNAFALGIEEQKLNYAN